MLAGSGSGAHVALPPSGPGSRATADLRPTARSPEGGRRCPPVPGPASRSDSKAGRCANVLELESLNVRIYREQLVCDAVASGW